MEVERCPLDIAGGPAVVVDDCHLVYRFQKILGEHLLGPIGVHHDQKGSGIGADHGIGGGEKGVRILRQGGQLIHHLIGGIGFRITDNVGGDPLFTGNGKDARRRPDAVQVRKAMSHDKDLRGILDQGGQGACHDAAFDLGMLFRILRPAAIELKVEAVFDHSLVAAPGKGHL